MTPHIDDDHGELTVLLAIHDDLERRVYRLRERGDAASDDQRAAIRDRTDRIDLLLRKIDARIRLAAERAVGGAPSLLT